MVSNVYSKSYLHASKPLEAQAEVILNSRLLPLLRKSAHESQAPHGLDVHSLFGATTMDFISAYCFGLNNGSNFIQNKLYRDHWLKLYMVRAGHGFFAQELPELAWILGLVGINLTPTWATAANKELEEWCKPMSQASLDLLAEQGEKVRDTADDPTVVRAILAGLEKEEKTSGKHSPIYQTAIQKRDLTVASEVIDHILAGQETTGVTLTYLSWHLSRSEDLQAKLRKELLSLSPSMVRQDGRVRLPDLKQLDALPILDAVITETIRKYAPAGGPEPRVAPASSCRIGAFEVPGGTRISASAFNLHRDEAVFPDAEVWDHTRWLQAKGSGSRTDAERQFWGFSSGGRMCLGSNFAMHGKFPPPRGPIPIAMN
jgi:cytochrome P450